MYKVLILFLLISSILSQNYKSKRNYTLNKNYTLSKNYTFKGNYTFYNDEGELITVGLPSYCQPGLGTTFSMWKNQTFTCDHLVKNDSFLFLQVFEYFPFEKLFVCDIVPHEDYYIVSNCEN